jgi:hypothetical protein
MQYMLVCHPPERRMALFQTQALPHLIEAGQRATEDNSAEFQVPLDRSPRQAAACIARSNTAKE